MEQSAEKLLQFIKNATSPFHVVKESISILENDGFKPLDFTKPWELTVGSSYYAAPYESTLFAFTIGSELCSEPTLRIAAAHTDHPGFRIKPIAEITEHNYLKVNTETYGGVILNTWLDRPLSIAGRVSLKSNDIFKPIIRLLDIKEPVLTIPNLAIHVNREVNKGVELNKQTDMLPILAMMNDSLNKDSYFISYLATQLQVDVSDILDFDLYVYNAEDGCVLGINQDFISAPRLDNLTSVYALLEAITTTKRNDGVNLIALFDNEEIGSRSKQGADSILTNILLEKIFFSLGMDRTTLYEIIMRSIFLSVDVAHGLHPNYPSKYDPINVAQLGDGIVLKIDSTQKYASDTEAIAIIIQLCLAHNIKYQKYVNRSDMTSGSTLGSIASAWMPMKTVDLGIPLLAMHSARELMGAADQGELNQLIQAFFKA